MHTLSVPSMRTSQVMLGAALLLLCGVLTPSLAQQEPNVSSTRVNCRVYAPECDHLCPVSTCSKNKTLYIQVSPPDLRVVQYGQLCLSRFLMNSVA